MSGKSMKGGVENLSPRGPSARATVIDAIARMRKNQRMLVSGSVIDFLDLARADLGEEFLGLLTLELRVAGLDHEEEPVRREFREEG